MSKSSVIILIIAAVVFTGLGFVVGQVMAEGSNPGSADYPVVSESYVDKLVGDRASAPLLLIMTIILTTIRMIIILLALRLLVLPLTASIFGPLLPLQQRLLLLSAQEQY